MRTKVILAMLGLSLSLFFITGCGTKPEVDMSKLDEENNYNYSNQDLGFSLKLPKEFIYYQTQRKETQEMIDVEIFVPTSDREYVQEIPGYAKPIVVRIYKTKEYWEKVKDADKDFEYQGDINGRYYALKFWDKRPSDWENKWSQEMLARIKSTFVID